MGEVPTEPLVVDAKRHVTDAAVEVALCRRWGVPRRRGRQQHLDDVDRPRSAVEAADRDRALSGVAAGRGRGVRRDGDIGATGHTVEGDVDAIPAPRIERLCADRDLVVAAASDERSGFVEMDGDITDCRDVLRFVRTGRPHGEAPHEPLASNEASQIDASPRSWQQRLVVEFDFGVHDVGFALGEARARASWVTAAETHDIDRRVARCVARCVESDRLACS